MNFKRYNAVAGAFSLLAAMSMASCIDGNDWDVDSSVDRLFSVSGTSLSVTPDQTTADVKWNGTPNTEYYLIEVSKDSLYDEIELGATRSIIFGQDKSIKKSPYTLENLDSDSRYFIRIKAMSDSKAESYWSYSEKRFFKTKSEQIMNPVLGSHKTDHSAVISWKAGSELTHMVLYWGEDSLVTEVTAEMVEAGTYEFTDLLPATNYTVNLFKNEVKRGYANFATYPKAPSADQVIYLNPGDSICQTLLDGIDLSLGSKITIAVPGDQSLSFDGTLVIPDGMSVNFFCTGGNTPLQFGLKTIDYAGTHEFVTFEGIDFVAAYTAYDDAGVASDATADYFMNQSKAAEVGTISMKNCTFSGYKKSFFRTQGSETKNIGYLLVDDCILHDLGEGYSCFHIDGTTNLGTAKITNSTLYNMEKIKCVFYSKKRDMEHLTMENLTVYNVGSGTNYFVDFGATTNGATEFYITKCLLAKTASETLKGVRSAPLPTIEETYVTSDWMQSANKVNFTVELEYAAADIFVNAAEGDFTIVPGLGIPSYIGDPRWIAAE